MGKEGDVGQHGVAERSDGDYDRIRARGRERYIHLAKHKEPKVEWWTCVGPQQNWGTQEPMWPISKGAISANPSARISSLASPKRNHRTGEQENKSLWYYSCGRSSALSNVDENALRATATPRIGELAHHKTFPQHTPNRNEYQYSCGRSTPIWLVPHGALTAEASNRIVNLSHPKKAPPAFQGERPLPWEVPEPAKKAKPSERLEQLSSPKAKIDKHYRDPLWPVSEAVRNSVATQRCTELARAKSTVEGFQPPREIEWPVTKAAKQASATGRLSELAQPVQRTNMNILQFNPDAFHVKPSALKGHFPDRIHALAQPIER